MLHPYAFSWNVRLIKNSTFNTLIIWELFLNILNSFELTNIALKHCYSGGVLLELTLKALYIFFLLIYWCTMQTNITDISGMYI